MYTDTHEGKNTHTHEINKSFKISGLGFARVRTDGGERGRKREDGGGAGVS